jgi:hypothetical protein
MTTVVDEKIGGATLRIETKGAGYRGAIIRKGHPVSPEEDDDLARLLARLRNQAGKLHPAYLGLDGAVARFQDFFHEGGFADPAFSNERKYKEAARDRFVADLPLDRAHDADQADAVIAKRAVAATNLLSPYEKMTMKAVLDSGDGPAFVRAAARFANDDVAGGINAMVAAVALHGRSSWPILTYLPYLWASDAHMFLKPTVTTDYAARIGHRFQFDYSSDPLPAVYESLLDLVALTNATIRPLGARDNIDAQSFIWVVGAYKETDKAHLATLRPSG